MHCTVFKKYWYSVFIVNNIFFCKSCYLIFCRQLLLDYLLRFILQTNTSRRLIILILRLSYVILLNSTIINMPFKKRPPNLKIREIKYKISCVLCTKTRVVNKSFETTYLLYIDIHERWPAPTQSLTRGHVTQASLTFVRDWPLPCDGFVRRYY